MLEQKAATQRYISELGTLFSDRQLFSNAFHACALATHAWIDVNSIYYNSYYGGLIDYTRTGMPPIRSTPPFLALGLPLEYIASVHAGVRRVSDALKHAAAPMSITSFVSPNVVIRERAQNELRYATTYDDFWAARWAAVLALKASTHNLDPDFDLRLVVLGNPMHELWHPHEMHAVSSVWVYLAPLVHEVLRRAEEQARAPGTVQV